MKQLTKFYYNGSDYNTYLDIPLYKLRYLDYIDDFKIKVSYNKGDENLFLNEKIFTGYIISDDIYGEMHNMVDDVLDYFYNSDDYNVEFPIFPKLEITLNVIEKVMIDDFKIIAHIDLNFYK